MLLIAQAIWTLQIAIDKRQRNDDKNGYTADIDRPIPAEGVSDREEMNHCPETALEDFINQELLVLPYVLNIPEVFEDPSLNQQHAIINVVFKEGSTFRDGMFRRSCINADFIHN